MNRVRVRSSNLMSVGWQNKVLEVQFHNGAIYQYSEVPREVAEELLRARSIGEYFKRNIEPFAQHKRLR